MSTLYVIPAGLVTNLKKAPKLAYKNAGKNAFAVTASHNTSKLAALTDDMTTIKWRPGVVGVSFVQFESSLFNTGTGTGFTEFDYIGVTGANWATAGATLSVYDNNGTLLAQASGFRDNQPVFAVFAERTATALKFEFTCDNDLLEVGEIYYGKTFGLPRNVSVGYSPGRWTNNDIITTGRTEANQFSNSTVRARGTTERFSINYVPLSFMDGQYVNFINEAKGLPVFFLWNQNERSQAVYGYWDASAPRFTSSFYSSIDLTIRGVA